ncbi:MAG: FkbM family methyltransferase, partial [Chitinophagaceae bacterium]
MKAAIQFVLQKLMGYKMYLFVFAIFSVYRFRLTKYDKEFAFFLRLIPQFNGNIVLDIGANIGVTSTLIGASFPQYSVWAFEPVQLNMDTLEKVNHYFEIKNVRMIQKAVGEKSGEIEIHTPIQKGVKKQGLSYIIENGSQKIDSQIKELAKMVSLDTLIEQFSKEKVAAIKMDVENYELFVLQGGTQFIQRHRPLIFAELWENVRKLPCIELMEGLGYITY